MPILNIYLLWILFKDIRKFAARAGTTSLSYSGWRAIAFIVLSALYRLPHLLSFLGLTSVLPILSAQRALNAYWQKEQAHLPISKWSWIEITACLIGSAILASAVIGA